MTLLVVIADQKRAILLADRRISVSGKAIDDEFNKVCVLFCDNARVAIAYTSFLTPYFDTSTWILENLNELSKNSDDYHDLIYGLSDKATVKFSSLTAYDNRLTIIIVGFIYDKNGSHPISHVISNCLDSNLPANEFHVFSSEPSDGKIVAFHGDTTNLPKNLDKTILKLLNSNLSSSDLLRFSYKQILNCTKRSGGRTVIGTQCNSAIISAEVNTTVTTTYHSNFKTYAAFGPNIIITKGGISYGSEIFTSTIIAGPEIRKKDKCWCGSGSFFKDCHMKKFGSWYAKFGGFKKPMYATFWMDFDEPRLSGKTFYVSSGYA